MNNFENNYFNKKNEGFKTSLKVAMVYGIIAALFALISNFNEVISYLKTLL
jgi:hypothetical protein